MRKLNAYQVEITLDCGLTAASGSLNNDDGEAKNNDWSRRNGFIFYLGSSQLS